MDIPKRPGIKKTDFRVIFGGTKIDYDPKKEDYNRKEHGYSFGDFVVGSMSEEERNTYIRMLVNTLTEAKKVELWIVKKNYMDTPLSESQPTKLNATFQRHLKRLLAQNTM